jgi:transcription factor SFP1
MLQNGTHPQPPTVPAQPPKRYPNTTTPYRPTATGAPYTIPSHAQQNQTQTQNHNQAHPLYANGHVNGNVHTVTAPRTAPRMGTWPAKPATTTTNTNTNSHNHTPLGMSMGIKTTPRPTQLPPVQRGRDAVLFSAIREDPVDMLARMR